MRKTKGYSVELPLATLQSFQELDLSGMVDIMRSDADDDCQVAHLASCWSAIKLAGAQLRNGIEQ
jgi:hypothetical protein